MEDNKIYFSNQPLIPINKPAKPALSTQSELTGKAGAIAFAQVLAQEVSGVKFSQHALQRLQSRNIDLKVDQLQKIGDAVSRAEKKGAKESLVLMDNLAFVVSVKNKTIITAMDGASIKDNVFTNIDSAVIV